MMTHSLITIVPTGLLTCCLLLSGCGGGEAETPRSTDVIKPAEVKPSTPDPAEAASEPEAIAQTDAAPVEEPMPEVVETPSEPEPATETASTPAPESEPATTPTEPPTEPPTTEPTETPEPATTQAEPSTSEGTDAVPVSVTLGAEPGGTTFKGRVTVAGNATASKSFVASKDPFCIALGELPDSSLVLGNDGGLGNVFVWLRKVPSGVEVPGIPEEPAVLDNAKCNFQPHAFVMRVGQTLLVKNADDTAHNTRISPIRNNAFNQTIGPNDRKGVEVVYSQTELVPIKAQCDIHPWMGNFHFPVDHPWAAITDENGNFEITGLPAGELEFRMWHERMGYVERSVEVTVADGETVEKTFAVEAAKLAE